MNDGDRTNENAATFAPNTAAKRANPCAYTSERPFRCADGLVRTETQTEGPSMTCGRTQKGEVRGLYG
jgi:hypothetical protein